MQRKDTTFFLDLYKCLVSVLRCKAKKPVLIEDDTCLERIFQAFKKVIKWDPKLFATLINQHKDLLSICSTIFEIHNNHAASTIIFATRVFGVFSTCDGLIDNLEIDQKASWKNATKELSNIPLCSETVPGNLQYAWLRSVHDMTECSQGSLEILVHFKAVWKTMFHLSQSPFMFVKQEAVSLISNLMWIVINGPCSYDNSKVEKSLSVATGDQNYKDACQDMCFKLDSLALETVLQVMTKFWKHRSRHDSDYTVTSHKLFAVTECIFDTKHRQEMIGLATEANPYLCNFVESICLNRFPSKQPRLSLALLKTIVINAVTSNPTKRSAFVMACSLAVCDSTFCNDLAEAIWMSFRQTLGLTVQYENENIDEVYEVILRNTKRSRREFTSIIQNLYFAALKMCINELVDQKHMYKLWGHLIRSVEYVYELDKNRGANPFWWQNFSLTLPTLYSLRQLHGLPSIKASCITCLNSKTIGTILKVASFSHGDQKAMLVSGNLAIRFLNSTIDCGEHSGYCSNHLQSLIECLITKANDLGWEVRDSALEVLCELFKIWPAFKEVPGCACLHSIHVSLYDCLLLRMDDVSSYVRASALKTTGCLMVSGWKLPDEQKTLFCQKAIETLQHDEEAFARRAALGLLSSVVSDVQADAELFSAQLIRQAPREDLPSEKAVLIKSAADAVRDSALHDPDWEVRLRSIDLLSTLRHQLSGFFDEDVSIKQALAALVRHLLTCGDPTVEESCQDFVSSLKLGEEFVSSSLSRFAGFSCFDDCSLAEKRKRLVAVQELKDLLGLVLFQVSERGDSEKLNDASSTSGDVIPDCY